MASSTCLTPLNVDELEAFWAAFEHADDGCLSFAEFERKLDLVHQDISPRPKEHNLNHPKRMKPLSDKPEHWHSSDLHVFICHLMPGCGGTIDKEIFLERVRQWNVPSQYCVIDRSEQSAYTYTKSLTWRRRFLAWWSVRGPSAIFLACVMLLQIVFGVWQLVTYIGNRPLVKSALGVGVLISKFSAGVLYPTAFFMVLSMSRWCATCCRRYFWLGLAINWDYSRLFHIYMAIATIFFGTLHGIGHLAGSIVHASLPVNRINTNILLGKPPQEPVLYSTFIGNRSGWTGVAALACLLSIGLTSSTRFRRWNYEAFQYVHLLMYPLFALLAMHGTKKLLGFPMLGFWLVVPVLLVLAERVTRAVRSFAPHPARLEALDDGTIVVTAEKPSNLVWRAKAGQFIFLQVPAISRFQWHPFTISACIKDRLQVHIKANGNWTNALHKLAINGLEEGCDKFVKIGVGIDGPFGAPAQQFSSYEKALIIGAGIGITPFAAILTDLEEKYISKGDPWRLATCGEFLPDDSTISPFYSADTSSLSTVSQESEDRTSIVHNESLVGTAGVVHCHKKEPQPPFRTATPENKKTRRVDFHWSVREKNDLLWFSDLLNRASAMSAAYPGQDLTLNVKAHVTAQPKDIATHVFRYLLDSYRTEEYPVSSLTGLRNTSHFGRPDYNQILSAFYDDMKDQKWEGKIGVFFCGSPQIGQVLADRCRQLTLQAKSEGHKMRFIMHTEVF